LDFSALVEAPDYMTAVTDGIAKYTGGFVMITLTAPDGLRMGEIVTHT
jgi:hypothetical protein